MAAPLKYKNAGVKSFRADGLTIEFLNENFRDRLAISANEFIVRLIQNSDEFKKYLARREKACDNTPSLDLYSQEIDEYSQVKTDMDKALGYIEKGDFRKFRRFGTGWHK